MSVANPWVFWLALAAVPVVAAFLIRRFRRQRQVSSVEIYRRMLAGQITKRRFAIPQHLIALLLTLLALLALLGAALDLRATGEPPRNAILIIDTSASMGTIELGEETSRLDRARLTAQEYLDGLRVEDRVAVVAAGAEAHLAMGWTDDPEGVAAYLATLTSVGHGSGLADAVRIADAMCQDPTRTEIILVSDGAQLGLAPSRCPLRFVAVGSAAANIAVTGLTVREADALGLNEIYLAVYNGSDYEREVSVELAVDGRLADVFTAAVAPHAEREELVRLPLRDGERLSATLRGEGEDALAGDNIGWAALRPGARVSALLVTRHPTTFLAEALSLHPRINLTVAQPDDLEPTAAGGVDVTGPFDLIVVDTVVNGVLPPAEHLVVLETDVPGLGLTSSGLVRNPELIRWAFEDPLFRFVNLDGVHILGAQVSPLPDGAVSLADMPDGPLIFQMQADDRDILVFTFHPDRSDLPLRVAFVNLVANLVEWAQPVDAMALANSVSVGARLQGAPAGAMLASLDNTVAPFAAAETVSAPGVYRLQDEGGVERALVAANLFSAREAELAPQSRLGIGAMQGWPEQAGTGGFPWWMLAVAALAMLVLEWILPALLARPRRKKPTATRNTPGRAASTAVAGAATTRVR